MAIQISTSEGDALRQAKADAGANPVNALTLAQALAYLQNNVTDLTSAKVYLAQLTKILFVLQAEVQRKK